MGQIGAAVGLFAVDFSRIFAGLCCLSRLRSIAGVSVIAVIAGLLSFFSLSRSESWGVIEDGHIHWEIYSFCVLVLTNIAFGMLVMLPLGLWSEILPMTGRLIDTMRGNSYAEQMLPGVESRSSPLELFGAVLSPWVFLCSGVYLPFLREILQPHAGMIHVSGEGESVQSCATSLSAAFHLSTPAILSLGVLEFGVALVSRICPRFPVGNEFQSIRLTLGLLIAAYVFGDLLPQFILLHPPQALRD